MPACRLLLHFDQSGGDEAFALMQWRSISGSGAIFVFV
jgi:hypothetical protein